MTDLVVIGAGPAGVLAALRAAEHLGHLVGRTDRRGELRHRLHDRDGVHGLMDMFERIESRPPSILEASVDPLPGVPIG